MAIPPQAVPAAAGAPAAPAWDTLFSEAGLDVKSFAASDPVWLPPVPFDSIAGFTGPMPGGEGVTLHLVAAAFRGRPVSFEIVAPWSDPSRDAPQPVGFRARLGNAAFFASVLFVTAAAAWFARRNARLGRGDRRGAARLGGGVFVVAFAFGVLTLHPALFGTLPQSLVTILFVPAGLAGIAWTLYLAFEPYFRRRYPDLLVSWTRLVGGRFGDPLVGRDLLGGLLLGSASFLLLVAVNAAPAFLASGGQTPVYFDADTLGGVRGVAANVAGRLVATLMQTLLSTAILFVGTLLLRRRPFAIGFFWVLTFAFNTGRENPILEIPGYAIAAALVVLALLRFGFVGLGAQFVVLNMLSSVPLTLDFSLWYAGYGLFFVLVVLALAAWGFWTARGGGSLIPEAALDG